MTSRPERADYELDARGLKCPLPRIKATLAMRHLSKGQSLRVLSDDPESPMDIAAWCTDSGHELISSSEEAGSWAFVIRKGSPKRD